MADKYCGPTGAGTQSGDDFTNRMALPDTTAWVRGNTYVYIGSVTSYGNRSFGTNASGTTTIVVRKANAAQDSGVAGWSSTFESTQAVFGTVTLRRPYFIFTGITRTETAFGAQPAGYGLRLSGVTASSGDGDDADNCFIHYADCGSAWAVNPSSGTINGYGVVINLVFNQTGVTFTHCAIHNGKGTLVQGAGAHNLVFDYCDFSNGWGKEAIRGGNQSLSTGWRISNCRFWNSTQTDPNDPTSGITAEIGIWDADSGSFDDFEVYNCQFFNEHAGGRNSIIVIGGDGGANWAGVSGSNNSVYGNTFYGIADPSAYASVLINGGTGNVAQNNLGYGNAEIVSYSANTTSNNLNASTDPFTNAPALDLTLTETSEARDVGIALSAPYNVDYAGNTRGVDGEWDVGAFEFESEPPPGDVTVNTTNLVVGTLTIG